MSAAATLRLLPWDFARLVGLLARAAESADSTNLAFFDISRGLAKREGLLQAKKSKKTYGVATSGCASLCHPVGTMNPAFLHEIQRLVVAQVCDCFDTVKSSAADALAEVLASYIKEIGRAAHECADVAGRTDVNIGDVLSALDAVGAKFQTIVRDLSLIHI